MKEVSRFDNSSLFLIVGRCIEDKCYILSPTASVCDARTILLHTCHSRIGHLLESWFVHGWGCDVVRNLRAPLLLSLVTEESSYLLNEVNI